MEREKDLGHIFKDADEGDKSVVESTNILNCYIADISRIPLLKHEQEIELARKISDGDEDARHKLGNSNLRLVVGIAKRHEMSDIHLLDLIQLGNLGLLKAVDRYDPSIGTRFASYASWWVRAFILNNAKESVREIRIPGDRLDKINELNKLKTNLYAEFDRDPKEKELAEASGMSVNQIRDLLTTPEVTESLDREITWGNQTLPYGETIEDPDQNVVEEVEANDLRARIGDLLDTLPDERRKEIIRLRYGLKDGHCYSYKEIQETFPEISIQRLHQLVIASIEGLYKTAKKMELDK